MSRVLSGKGLDWPKIRGMQAFFAENTDMAYYRQRKPPATAPDAPQFPGPVDIWDTISAPLAGLWQGLGGKNLNYDQWIREKARKRRGLPTQRRGWLGRITGR